MKKRMFSILCVLALCMALLPATAFAESRQYLALGDSITTGYATGGSEIENPFADQVAEGLGYTMTNLAEDGETTASLLAKMQTTDVSAADLITLTIGGNDLMGALYGYLAAKYNEGREEDQKLDAAGVQEALISGDPGFLHFAATELPGFAASEQAREALTAFTGNLTAIVAAVRAANPDVTLLVATQYNPYRYLGKQYGEVVPQAQTISDGFEAGLAVLNGAIAAAGQTGAFEIVDVYAAFETAVEAGINPCNPSFTPPLTINLDFHPNQTGHDLIAAAVKTALGQTEPPVTEEPQAFADVPQEAWYANAVSFVAENSLMSGYGNGNFGPSDTLSRAQLCQILYNAAGKPAVTGSSGFTDVAEGAWYADAVAWANALGVVGGYGDGLFVPNAPITRQELAAMLYRFAQLRGWDVSVGEDTNILSYTDFDQLSQWAIPAMQWACGAGIIRGVREDALEPQGNATRAQAAVMLMRFIQE